MEILNVEILNVEILNMEIFTLGVRLLSDFNIMEIRRPPPDVFKCYAF